MSPIEGSSSGRVNYLILSGEKLIISTFFILDYAAALACKLQVVDPSNFLLYAIALGEGFGVKVLEHERPSCAYNNAIIQLS